MPRFKLFSLLVALSLWATPSPAGDPDPQIQSFLRSLEGRTLHVRIPVLRVDGIIGHADTSYVYPDGRVLYKYHVSGFRKTVTDDARDLAREIRHAARIRDDEFTRPRLWRPGTRVRIHGMRVKDREAQINITRLFDGSKSSIRIAVDDGRITLRDVREALPMAFHLDGRVPAPPKDDDPPAQDRDPRVDEGDEGDGGDEGDEPQPGESDEPEQREGDEGEE